MSDIKNIIKSVIEEPTHKREHKENRTLSLNSKNFRLFQKHCVKHKKKVSDVVDKLIASYLTELNEMGELLDLDDMDDTA